MLRVMQSGPGSSDLEVRLSSAEALVLFELLSRWTAEADRSRPSADMFESAAEPIALSHLLGRLETQLTTPLGADYDLLLKVARRALVELGGEDFAL